jgi:hypothetical protein
VTARRLIRATAATVALAGAGAVAVGGCALGPASATSSSTSTAAAGPVAQADRTHEYPAPAPRQTAPGARAPVLAIEAFATGYINWRATTVSRTMRALEAISIGQARSEVALAATQTAQDYELRHGGVANSGTVEAVAPVLGRRDQYAVVTRERTTATNTSAYQGLPVAWHLTLATVTRLSSGAWVVSGWQPQS